MVATSGMMDFRKSNQFSPFYFSLHVSWWPQIAVISQEAQPMNYATPNRHYLNFVLDYFKVGAVFNGLLSRGPIATENMALTK